MHPGCTAVVRVRIGVGSELTDVAAIQVCEPDVRHSLKTANKRHRTVVWRETDLVPLFLQIRRLKIWKFDTVCYRCNVRAARSDLPEAYSRIISVKKGYPLTIARPDRAKA